MDEIMNATTNDVNEITPKKISEDNFSYSSSSVDNFIDAILEMEKNTSWIKTKTSEIRASSLSKNKEEPNTDSIYHTPQLAVCLLVDESGSMNGIKIAKALETAILLEDFCRGLNLPISVIGHSYYDGVRLNQYIMFDGNKNDKYRLASMSAGGDNRDGFALRYCIKLLEKRQEPGKLLILISDGQPLAPDYYGETAYADLKDAKSMCKKRNITLFTAAIDADKQQIKKIYGEECFLDITNLNELPQKMLRLVLKELNK